MSVDVRTATLEVLAPLVGKAMATIYVSEAARICGKTSEMLDASDLQCVSDVIRQKIGAFASSDLIDEATAELKRLVAE